MRTLSWTAVALAMGGALIGCGSDADNTTAGGQNAGGAGGCAGADCNAGGSAGNGGSGATGGSGGHGGSGGGGDCGRDAGVCGPTEYCDFPDERCGQGSPGICKPRPMGCPENFSPTCGCDGMIHSNGCDAQGSGTDVSNLGNCPAAPGDFACGSGFCTQGTQYCQRSLTDVGGTPDSYSCLPLPAGCGATPTCACVASEPCGTMCAASADGDLTVSCPGG